MSKLREQYKQELLFSLKKKLNLKNIMEIPRITKITINMGVGEAVNDKKIIDNAIHDLSLI